MPYSNPILNLPDVEETIAFRALERVLRNDATLQSLGTLIACWTGSQEDLDDPPPGRPYILLTPMGVPSGWETEGQHRMPLSVLITAVVEGTNADAIMNFYGAIRRAFFPVDPSAQADVRAAMNAAGVVNGTLTRPAYGFKVDDANGSHLLVAQGQTVCIR
jgi:hypothetical protein